MNEPLRQAALAIPPAVIAITLHEAAHGYAALALGDDTARRAGRLSLNPLRHLDPVGTLLLPGLLLAGQLLATGHVGFMFGWARPVPVRARRLRDPRRGMALVAAAGPAVNFGLAWLGALALHALPLLPEAMRAGGAAPLQLFIVQNLGLGLFNLLPIPPLDGGRIAVGLLPERMARAWAGIEHVGLPAVLALVYLLPMATGRLGHGLDPVGWAMDRAMAGGLWLALRAAGFDAGG